MNDHPAQDRPPADDAPADAPAHGLSSCWRRGRGVLAWAVLALLVMTGQELLLEHAGPWTRAAELIIVLLPVLAFVGLFVAMWRHVMRLDELQRRMQLESLALTVILASLVCLTLGQLQQIGAVGPTRLDLAWVVIAFTYVGSSLVVKLRYR